MKEALVKLLKIKSLVTIGVTIAFIILALTGAIEPEQFMVIFTTIIAFYFGTQTVKSDKKEE